MGGNAHFVQEIGRGRVRVDVARDLDALKERFRATGSRQFVHHASSEMWQADRQLIKAAKVRNP